MNGQAQADKWICCGGVVFMSIIAVVGWWFGKHDIALFGAGGFTAFSGPLFMAMNRDNMSNGNGKNGSGSADPTQAH